MPTIAEVIIERLEILKVQRIYGVAGDSVNGITDTIRKWRTRIAEGAGLFGIRVEDPGELEDALKKAFDHKGPALVDIAVNRLELSMPPKLSLEHVVGFNLWMMQTVMNGRGDEVIELAKTNLFRN